MIYSDQLLQSVKDIKHVALDMDGTIYNGSTLFPFTIPFLQKLTQLGIGYSFLTNNSSKSVDDYMAHLKKLGI
ncbi:MAG: hydrolase, partial [Bacteroidales bacterium]